jgi:hypothetical protein
MISDSLEIHVLIKNPYTFGSSDYWKDIQLRKSVTELYVTALQGYIPEKADCITIIPGFHHRFKKSKKNGAVIAIAPSFDQEKYDNCSDTDKKHYILEIIQFSLLQLADEYHWNKDIFLQAFLQSIERL